MSVLLFTLIMWLVVFPACLVGLMFVIRALYRYNIECERQRRAQDAIERVNEQLNRKTE